VIPGYSDNIEKYSAIFKEELKKLFEPKEYSKGDFLFKQGELCRHLYYIESGLVRIYYFSSRGKEITVWFSAENTIVTAIDSFYYLKPTRDYCEALEDLVLYAISYTDLEALLNNKKGAQITFYILYEVARKMTALIDSIRFQTAEERYKSLTDNYPSILQRASLGQIASYLGITQETLSRIRANK
jgi:CRP-like cAMP-binding protein